MNGSNAGHVTISHDVSQEDVDAIRKGLADFDRARTRGGMECPGIEIDLVLKDPEGKVVGGLNASTMLSVMHLEVLWVAEAHRKLGYGAALVLEAERIGKQKGCITSQTMTFSFQAPEFYQKIGYQVLGVYDGYCSGITESTLMKRLQHQRQTHSAGYQMGEHGEPGVFS